MLITQQLFIVFLITQLLDIWTTLRFLKNGTGHEANPVMAYLFKKFGVVESLVIVKTLACGIVWLIQTEVLVVAGLCLFYLVIVLNNYRIGTKK